MKKIINKKMFALFAACVVFYAIVFAWNFPSGFWHIIQKKTTTDFSSIHGEGFDFDGSVICFTEDDAYFVLDMGEQRRNYYNVVISLSADAPQKNKATFSLGHSSGGDEKDMVVVPGKESADGNEIRIKYDSDFSNRQYLRFCFHNQAGTSYRLISVEQGYRYFFPSIMYVIILVLLSLLSVWIIQTVRNINKRLDYPLRVLDDSVKQKTKWIIVLFPQISFLVWLVFVRGLYFAMNDDIVIRDIANGYCGKYSAYLCSQVSPIFGAFILLLNKMCSLVNWLTLVYVAIMIASMLFVDSLVTRKVESVMQTVFASLTLFIAWQYLWLHFTFTIVSFAGVIAGLIGLCYAIQVDYSTSKWFIGCAIVLIFLGVCIRPWTLYLIIIVLSFYALYQLLQKHDIKVVGIYGGSIVAVYLFGYVNRLLLSFSKNQYAYWMWNKARAGVGDYLSYDNVVSTGVWTDSATKSFYGCVLWDKKVFSLENLNTIISMVDRKPFDISRLQILLLSLTADFREMPNKNGLLWLLLLVVALLFISKKGSIKSLCFFMGTTLAEAACYIWGRYPYRVIMPIIISGVLFLLVFGEYGGRIRYYVGIPIMVLLIYNSYLTMDLYPDYINSSNLDAYNYLDNQDDNIYLMTTPQMYNLPLAENAFVHKRDGKKNLIGNWDTYSDAYYNLIETYEGVDKSKTLAQNIVDCDNIYLLTDHDAPVAQYLLDFLYESTGSSVKTVLCDQIEDTLTYGTIDVWRVVVKE